VLRNQDRIDSTYFGSVGLSPQVPLSPLSLRLVSQKFYEKEKENFGDCRVLVSLFVCFFFFFWVKQIMFSFDFAASKQRIRVKLRILFFN
jgi:hypothetical protein